jgi:hypothetical protein
MSRIEILKRASSRETEQRTRPLDQALTAAEQLPRILMPLAQAMATLTDQTNRALQRHQQLSKELTEQHKDQAEKSTRAISTATAQARQAAAQLQEQIGRVKDLAVSIEATRRPPWLAMIIVGTLAAMPPTTLLLFLLHRISLL